jgi:hypothetical protein
MKSNKAMLYYSNQFLTSLRQWQALKSITTKLYLTNRSFSRERHHFGLQNLGPTKTPSALIESNVEHEFQ